MLGVVKISKQMFVMFFEYPPTAASLNDCFTTKQSLAGLEFRLSAECSPGDVLVLKCSIIWLAHMCISDTKPIISGTEVQCQHSHVPDSLQFEAVLYLISLQLCHTMSIT